ncbi:MAG: DUF1858 domain-containing protein [Clostridia bacterium]|nr:DUF1858 domain-containing protein [Clostridia bacterium]
MSTINKEMTLGELLERFPQSETILLGFGMHCFSCPMSRMETIEEAAEVHDIDLELLLDKLNNMDADCECDCDDCDCEDCYEEDCDCGCCDDDCECDEYECECGCGCDEDCDCGCQEGYECTCHNEDDKN